MKALRAIAALALCVVFALGLAACGGSSDDAVSEQTPSIAAGICHTVALNSDRTLWAWGYNGYGQLGNGTTVSSTTPALLIGFTM